MKQLKTAILFLSSMPTGLVILTLLGIIAGVGSVVLPEFYFHTPLFKALLLLLFLNMALCSFKQIKKYLADSRKGFTVKRSRFKQTGVVLLHLGIVLVLIGGAVNTYIGQSARISILEGDTVELSGLIKAPTPLELQLDQFIIEFNPDGTPAQYYSSLNLWQDGQQLGSYRISVNHPLNYQGMKAYQESFGHLIQIEGDFEGSGKISRLFEEGDLLSIPGSDLQVKIYKYIPNFDLDLGMESETLRPDNPRLIFSVYEKGQLLGVGTAAPDERIEISKGNYLTFAGVKPFTVLKLKSDPGIPLTGAGGISLMIGACMALFTPPSKSPRHHKGIASTPVTQEISHTIVLGRGD